MATVTVPSKTRETYRDPRARETYRENGVYSGRGQAPVDPSKIIVPPMAKPPLCELINFPFLSSFRSSRLLIEINDF